LSTIVENSVVPLSDAIKAMAMLTGEDYTKVKSSYGFFAAYSWDEINRQYIGQSIEKALLPVHKSLNTISIPLCAKEILFVGVIDDCGRKVELTNRTKLTSGVSKIPCEDLCNSCNQPTDICDKLIDFPPETKTVVIDGNSYTNTYTRSFDNGVFYIKKEIWVKDYTTNAVKQVVEREIINEYDTLECGCIAPTNDNIEKIKADCYSCYCSCYAPCSSGEYDLGGYRVFSKQGVIQLEKNLGYNHIYVEWRSSLPRVNGELVLPEEALQSVVAGGIYYSTQSKKNVNIGTVEKNLREYKRVKKNMHIERCRLSIDDIKASVRRIPKFDISLDACSDYFGSGTENGTQQKSKNKMATVPFIPPFSSGGNIANVVVDPIDWIVTPTSTPLATGQTTTILTQFIGHNINFFRGALTQYTTNPGDGSVYYSWNKVTGQLQLLGTTPEAQEGERMRIYV
jgi:hypothetical protein